MPVVLKRIKKGEIQPRHSVGYYFEGTKEEFLRNYPIQEAKDHKEWLDQHEWPYPLSYVVTLTQDAWIWCWEDDNPEWGPESP